MANLSLPSTVTVAATATEITIDGLHDCLELVNHGTVPVYVRADGTAAEVAADQNYALPAAASFPVEIRTAPSGGTLATDDGTPVTVLSAIATSGTAVVSIQSC